ncbi:MAG TPA: hypothetical protein VG323_09160 [Thermoanaerobaculia bacterium]|nr:hypothetical protein [Thermoanaerobaculia bacterium]
MRLLTSATLLLLLCAPLAAQTIEAVEMAPATLEQLARASVVQPPGELEKRPRPARAATRSTRAAIVADFVTVTNGIPAPPAARGFKASFDPLPGATTGYAPPDASGAVGPHHVVGAFNNSLTVHDRNGNLLSPPPLSIYQFWHDPAFADTTVTDPRVMYDAANDRWALAMLGGDHFGVLLLAFSSTGDPAGLWRRFRINANPANVSAGLDFTRMAMTADQIVVTANEFVGEPFTGANVYTIAKSAAFSPVAAVSASLTHSSSDFDFTPVTSRDATIRIATQDGPGILLYELRGNALVEVNDVAPPVSFGAGPGLCDQLATGVKVECDDTELHYAFVRDGVLWIVHSAYAGRGVIVVWKITGGTAKGFVIGDPSFDYGYPSLAVNRLGAALLGYEVFDRSIYPSAAYRYIDPSGIVSDPVTVKSGESWFGFQRWGDYSSTLVDPVDDTSFWTIQEYGTPASISGSHNTWGTWWTYVKITPRMRAVRH